MDAILLFGACSAAESLGKILFTPAVGSSTSSGSNSGSNSSIDIGSFCKDDASASSSDAEFEFEIDETPEADEISVVPVCGDGGDESSPWRIVVSRSVSSKRQQKRRRRQRRRRSVRFSKPSALDTIVVHTPTNPYPCCASTYASTASTHTNTTATGTATATPSMIVSPDRTSTTCSSSSSFDDIIGITDLFGPEDSLPTPSSTPSIEVTLGIVDASFSSSASSSFEFFGYSSSSLSHSHSQSQSQSQSQQQDCAQQRHRCMGLGRTKRIHRVRKLLEDELAHRQQRRRELLMDREGRVCEQADETHVR